VKLKVKNEITKNDLKISN